MATGLLYTKLQPQQMQNPFLQVMESERQRYLAGQTAKAEKMKEYQKDLFKDFKDVDVQGDFLASSVKAMDQAKRFKVDLYNKMRRGGMSEDEYILASERINSIPDLINSSYQSYEGKLSQLAEGDELMNFDSKNTLAYRSNGIKLDFNDKNNDLDVTYNYIEDGKKKTKTVPRSQFVNEINSIPVTQELGSPLGIADEIGNKFKSDVSKIASDPTFSVERKGLAVGTSKTRFNEQFDAHFGSVEDKSNLLVKKAMVGSNKTYDEAREFLYNNAISKIPKFYKEYRSKLKEEKEGKNPNKDLLKNNLVVPSETGRGKKALSSIKTVDGDMNGLGFTYTMPDSKKKMDLEASSIKGVPKGITEKIKVNKVFMTKDGRIFITGSAAQLNTIAEVITNSKLPESEKKSAIDVLLNNRGRNIDWIELNGSGADMLRSSVMGARSADNMYNTLTDFASKMGKPTNEESSGIDLDALYKEETNK